MVEEAKQLPGRLLPVSNWPERVCETYLKDNHLYLYSEKAKVNTVPEQQTFDLSKIPPLKEGVWKDIIFASWQKLESELSKGFENVYLPQNIWNNYLSIFFRNFEKNLSHEESLQPHVFYGEIQNLLKVFFEDSSFGTTWHQLQEFEQIQENTLWFIVHSYLSKKQQHIQKYKKAGEQKVFWKKHWQKVVSDNLDCRPQKLGEPNLKGIELYENKYDVE